MTSIKKSQKHILEGVRIFQNTNFEHLKGNTWNPWFCNVP